VPDRRRQAGSDPPRPLRHRGPTRGPRRDQPRRRGAARAARALLRVGLRRRDGGPEARHGLERPLQRRGGRRAGRDAVAGARRAAARNHRSLPAAGPAAPPSDEVRPAPRAGRDLAYLHRRDPRRGRLPARSVAGLQLVRRRPAQDAARRPRVARVLTVARGRLGPADPHLSPEPARPRRLADPAARGAPPLGAARRRAAVVHDRFRTRQHDRGLPGPAVPARARAGDAAGAGRAAGDGLGRLRRRTAREDPARAAARHAERARRDPARLLRRARHDDAVSDPARRVRALDRRPRVRARARAERPRGARVDRRAGGPRRRRLRRVRKRSNAPSALENRCWKDSDDSIRFADGRRAQPPIATCEQQGYAYDARLRLARLAREVYGDPSSQAGSTGRRPSYGAASTATSGSQTAATTRSRSTPRSSRSTRRPRTPATCSGAESSTRSSTPVEYPDALKPQAWAAGAPLLALRTLLGLDAVNGKLRRSAHVPESRGRIRLRGLDVPRKLPSPRRSTRR
jgi:hypothetical protein